MPQDNSVVLENVELIFRNFTGKEGMYNREGDRSFAIKLDEATADMLTKDGWNVKTLRARPDDEDQTPQPYLSVSVEYDKGRPPSVFMITSRGRTQLDRESVESLDDVDIEKADLILRPYDWNVNGNTGRKAYLQALYLTVNENPLELKYGDIATVQGPMMEKTGPYVPSDER